MEYNFNNAFSEYHPIVNFMYFCIVIIFSMIFKQPVLLMISIIASFSYSTILNGIKAIKFNLYFLLPMFFVVIILNPFFSHKGITILFYINNKPITLEAFIYGVIMAMMLVSMTMWFSCYNKIIASEKIIYIFSRTIPTISLMLSMTLSFVPRFKVQIKKIRTSQRNIGRDINSGGVYKKIQNGCKIISILITWALENGVQTADSMRARGYGLSGRTHFSIYRIERRDKISLMILLTVSGICLLGYIGNKVTMQIYPYIKINEVGITDYIIYLSYGLLTFFPIIVEIVEELRWKLLK